MIEIELNGKYKLILPPHRQQQWLNKWEDERISSMIANIKESNIVFDIGTEEGDISALLAQRCKEIVLVEPTEKVWENIRAIFSANGIEKPLGMYPGFASNLTTKEQPESITEWPVRLGTELKGNYGFRNLSEDGVILPQIRLDELKEKLNVKQVDLLNIDVEGSEYEVLKGAKQILTFDRPLVYVSVHPEMMFWHHHQYEQNLHEYMSSVGYKAKHLAFDHEHHWFFYPIEREII